MKRIHVAVKIKPVLQSEKENKTTVYWKAKSTNTIYQTAYPNKVFYFDDVFNEQEDNETVYLHFCSSLVRLVIQGYNGTIMTFGQVSSGKTHTILGDEDKKVDGLLFFIIRHIFELIEDLYGNKEILIRVSCFEIYKEEIRDLLSSTNESLNLLEENGHVKVSLLSEHVVQQPREIFDFFREAESRRIKGDTLFSENGSKSHLIFRMVFEICDNTDGAIHISELNLVDFAGLLVSEQEMNEFPKCKNDSLTFLSEIILQLRHEQAKDVNYERSKLTRILKNSFGGKALTLLICTVIPTNLIETFYALQFGIAAMHVKNESKVVASAEKSLICKLRGLHYLNFDPIESAARLQQAQGMDETIKKMISYCEYFLIPVLKMKTYNLKSLCGSSSSTLRCRKSLASHSQPFIIKTKQNVKHHYIPENKKKV